MRTPRDSIMWRGTPLAVRHTKGVSRARGPVIDAPRKNVQAPEWPALLAATTTATLILRADPSYPTRDGGTLPRLAHAEKNFLKRRAAESPFSFTDESVRVPPRVSRTVLTHP